MPAMWMIVNCKNGISSYELAGALGVTQKTAWFMLHRIREAMKSRTFKAGIPRNRARSRTPDWPVKSSPVGPP